jgi:hypothetical protein
MIGCNTSRLRIFRGDSGHVETRNPCPYGQNGEAGNAQRAASANYPAGTPYGERVSTRFFGYRFDFS